ncbi:hypothetical protein H257_05308 [Aphanomyces astaci]|uniref:Uncharacterized protein n=1 Tax=Aphanomyces astaci TaxID=112090 RepID=W4GPQ1_APHAT|nr:hypothetical protein H257_05308 [Aphanomyces astaci]ETV81705.1 hypothetical protein H257_05308 [Aphanomyces astaci]|eukprot:XP_009828442.1 hypothetical protein H257_05308 [Aphanomyces astaci]
MMAWTYASMRARPCCRSCFFVYGNDGQPTPTAAAWDSSASLNLATWSRSRMMSKLRPAFSNSSSNTVTENSNLSSMGKNRLTVTVNGPGGVSSWLLDSIECSEDDENEWTVRVLMDSTSGKVGSVLLLLLSPSWLVAASGGLSSTAGCSSNVSSVLTEDAT